MYLGIDLSTLRWDATSVSRPADAFDRYLAMFPDDILDFDYLNEGTRSRWDDSFWRYMPAEHMLKVFTLSELLAFWHGDFVESNLEIYFKDTEKAKTEHYLLWKIQNAMWHWSRPMSFKPWQANLDHLLMLARGIANLNFGDGFEVRLDHTRYFNPAGSPWYKSCDWLDGAFGLCVYRKGVHVLTVGFSPTSEGVLIQQVQLKENKGNRWLFTLKKHFLDYTLDRFAEAFPCPIFLIEGQAALAAVRVAYGKGVETFEAKGASERIVNLYNRPLEDFDRGPLVRDRYQLTAKNLVQV